MSPTLSPFGYSSVSPTQNAVTLEPTMQNHTMAPSLPVDQSKFEITLFRVGGNNKFDDAFNQAKLRWEQVVKGDLTDQAIVTNPAFDWFGGEWEDLQVNIPIDDVLIGYEFTEIDGEGGILGMAGPKYARVKQESGSITTISGYVACDVTCLHVKTTFIL